MYRYVKSSSESNSRRFYAVTDNRMTVGYLWYCVSFDSKRKRDEFCKWNPEYHPITATELKKSVDDGVLKDLQRYIDTIIDTNRKMVGMVFFDYDGNFDSISYV